MTRPRSSCPIILKFVFLTIISEYMKHTKNENFICYSFLDTMVSFWKDTEHMTHKILLWRMYIYYKMCNAVFEHIIHT